MDKINFALGSRLT